MPKSPRSNLYEAEVPHGLADIARQEIMQRLANQVSLHPASAEDTVLFLYHGDPRRLSALRTVTAVYQLLIFDLPRPKALLGHAHFTRLSAAISACVQQQPCGAFRTFAVNAAGSDSPVMKRFRSAIADETGLVDGHDDGDLLLRVRRGRTHEGWDVLIRLTPRPLATRDWRIHNMEGALNAAVAHAMALMTGPADDDSFLNIACGSGTMLIERLDCGPLKLALGLDLSSDALALAHDNIAASQSQSDVYLLQADAGQIPLPAHSVSALCADLPFGQRVGSHAENAVLYPRILHEAARISQRQARFVLITHEVRLMAQVLAQSEDWRFAEERMITLRGLHPRIYTLVRK